MIQDVLFAGPTKKVFLKPTSKGVFREKERKRRKNNKTTKKALAAAKKIENESKVSKIEQVKEEGMKEYLNFFLNYQDYRNYYEKAHKVHDKKKKVHVKLDAVPEEEEEVVNHTDFLNPAEYQQIKGSINDLNVGELCFQFVNPDDPLIKDKPVTFEEAEKVFEDILTVTGGPGAISRSMVVKQKKAFLLAFLQLKDYVPPVVVKRKKKVYTYITPFQVMRDLRLMFQKSLSRTKVMKIDSDQEADLLVEDQEEQRYEDFLEEYLKYKDEPIPTYTRLQYLSALSKIKMKDKSVFAKLKKRFSQGGFLFQRFTDDHSDWDWICQDNQPNDFLTLIRFTIMTKLGRDAHLHVRSFLSSDGKYIYVVLKSKIESVMKFSEVMAVNKQYELGYADLFSLEPVDHLQRPLRLKSYIRDPEYLESKKELLDETFDAQEISDKKASLERIESKAQKIYQSVLLWGEQELRAQVVVKQRKVDKWIKKVARDMHINQVHEKVELINDQDCDREVWEGYFLYLEFLDDFFKRVEGVDKHPEVQQNKGFIYKLIMLKALSIPNQLYWSFYGFFILQWFREDTKVLRNVWDRMGVPPVAPYGKYFNASLKECMWRKYQINEKELRSEFQNNEKMRTTHQIIQQHIDVMRLVQQEYVLNYFPLHDHYQLKGITKIPLVKSLIDMQLLQFDPINDGEKRLNDIYVSLKDGAEATDFNVECLADSCAFQVLYPWQIPIQNIRDYFGEKVALYFRFLQFYTRQLFLLCLVSIICQAVIDKSTPQSRQAFLVMWAVSITVWSSVFSRFWLQQQVIFQLQFGQTTQKTNQSTRPAFYGKFKRSVVTDNLNDETYPAWIYNLKMIFSLIITLLVLILVVGCCFANFILKEQLREKSATPFVFNVIPSLVNAFIIQSFNYMYFQISNDLNTFENHKYVENYENSFIIKNFAFIFVNTFASMFIISFLDPTFPFLHICKQADGTENCFFFLQNQMISIFILNFVKNIPDMIAPCVKVIYRSQSRHMDETPVLHEFLEIDTFIEDQAILEAYQTNFEVDGTVADYMELVIQYSFLNLFGLAFPASYFLAFLSNVLEIQVNKVKLIYLFQRPFPTQAADIGNWFAILEIVNFLGISCNAGLVAFTSGAVKQNISLQMQAFVVILILLLFTKFVTQFLIEKVPFSARQVKKRHENAVERVMRGIGQTSSGYKPGIAKMQIDCVDYSKTDINLYSNIEHIIKGPNVVLIEK